jgi:hypothetical protein
MLDYYTNREKSLSREAARTMELASRAPHMTTLRGPPLTVILSKILMV